MKRREFGLDLIRAIAVIFVISVHFYYNNGFYFQKMEGLSMWLAGSSRWLFYTCVPLFMLITGYLRANDRPTKKYYSGLFRVVISWLIISLICLCFRVGYYGTKKTVLQWIGDILNYGTAQYSWYVEMYIGLILISPVINLALDSLKKPKQIWLLTGGVVLATTLPTITSARLLPEWWTAMYPIGYYMIGAAIRRTKPKIPPVAGLLGAALCAMGMGLASLLTTNGGKFNDGFSQGGYGGFWTTLMVTCLFLGVYRFRAGKRTGKVLSFCAAGVFEGYILSRLLDVWIYKTVKFWHNPETYILIFLCVTIPVFILSMLAGRLVHSVSAWIIKPRNKG